LFFDFKAEFRAIKAAQPNNVTEQFSRAASQLSIGSTAEDRPPAVNIP
jgi:hypothetical protein